MAYEYAEDAEDNTGEKFYYPADFNSKGTGATLKAEYRKETFDVEDFGDYTDKIKVIDATAVDRDLNIIANDNANKIYGSDEDDFISAGKGKDTIEGNDGNDTIDGGAGNDSISGGAGKDLLTGGTGSDTFLYYNGSGNDIITDYSDTEGDKIQFGAGIVINDNDITTTSAGSVVFKVNGSKLTLKNAADQEITYTDDNGTHTRSATPVIIDGTHALIKSTYTEDLFSTADYSSKIKTVDASAVYHDLEIVANKLANEILAGAGNNTLTGGAGKDLFRFDEDNGSDVITDFTTADKIQIVGGTSDNVSATVAKNGNVIISHAGGSVTLQDAGKLIFDIYNDSNEVVTSVNSNDPIKYNAAGTSATLTSYYTDDEFTADSTLITINAAQVTHALDITGNKKSNYITSTKQADEIDGGAGADTLIGGKGNDTFEGGKGADVFVYQSGDGKDVIEDYEDADRIQIIGGTSENVTVTTAANGNVIVKHGSGRVHCTQRRHRGCHRYRRERQHHLDFPNLRGSHLQRRGHRRHSYRQLQAQHLRPRRLRRLSQPFHNRRLGGQPRLGNHGQQESQPYRGHGRS